MNKTLKINDKVVSTDFNNKIVKKTGTIIEIDHSCYEPYLISWNPKSDYDIENIGNHYEWCNKYEFKLKI
jgi:hypothetical protein